MVKNKLVRNAVAVVVALGVIGTIPVFAESYDMEDGHAYNNATSSGGIKCCDAGTINDRSGEYASLYLRTTYQDGQESDYWSGVVPGSVHENTGWDWAEDYYSIHRLHRTSSGEARDRVELSSCW